MGCYRIKCVGSRRAAKIYGNNTWAMKHKIYDSNTWSINNLDNGNWKLIKMVSKSVILKYY